MIDYTLSIDVSGGKNPNGFFEIGVIQLGEMKSELIDGNIRVERRGFGDIEVRNEPYKYAKLGSDRYNLYDIISSVSPSQEIWLKFTSVYETLYAYFGIIDCKLDDDQKKITIKPYILDQYTDLLENRETEVKLFDETNQIVNGDFKEGTDLNPTGWTKFAGTILEKGFFQDSSCIKIPIQFLLSGQNGIIQSFSNALSGKQTAFSFNWALTGNSIYKENLELRITLEGNVNDYNLTSEGKWIPFDSDQRIFYSNQTIAIPESSAQYKRFSLVGEASPESGIIKIVFYHYSTWFITESDITNLILTNVIASTSSIELKTIKIQLSDEKLVTKNEDAKEIIWSKRKPKANFYSTKLNYQQSLDSFFDGNGKPIQGNLVMSDDNGITINDVINFFKEPISKSYKYELSAITIFKCEYIATKKRRFRAICEFSREEIYYTKISDGNGGYLPPETDAGWINTFTNEPSNSNRYLWVRTPFNGIELPWSKSAIDIGDWRTYYNTFGYYDSVKSVKQYPVSVENSVEIVNAIDLREVFTKVYRETHISLRGKSVYSNFLWNDALSVQEIEDVYLNNNTETNYASMTDSTSDVEPKNELNKILAVHTYEFSTDPTTDKEKTVLKISFNDLMSDFLAHFPQCYWFIDTNKDLHIEHVKYFDRINKAKDLTVAQYYYIREYQSWEYIKEKLFSLENYEFKNSGNIDFISSKVTFDKITTNKRGQDTKNDITGKVLSTDVAFCLENRNSLDNGIVLMIYDTVDDENICRKGMGCNTRNTILNGDLSIASLLVKYATYEGTWQQGQIDGKGFWNNQDGVYKYYTTKHVREAEEITIKGIFLDKIIFTNLGLGIVAQRKVDYENEVTKLVAVYRYSDPFPIYGSGKDEPII